MKKILLFVLFAVLAMTACHTNNSTVEPDKEVKLITRVVADEDGDLTQCDFTYDNQNRPTKIAIRYSDDPTENTTINIAYQGQKATYTVTGEEVDEMGGSMTFNTDSSLATILLEDKSGVMEQYKYSYNTAGQMTTIDYRYEGDDDYTNTYAWANGNVTGITADAESGSVAFEYGTAKNNYNFDPVLFFLTDFPQPMWNLYGNHCANFPTKMTIFYDGDQYSLSIGYDREVNPTTITLPIGITLHITAQ